MNYRTMHLKQQAAERRFLDDSKKISKQLNNELQPERAFFFSDGFTIRKCDTPRIGKRRQSKSSHKKLESRIIAMEVICGPIDGIFVYYTDNIVSGGANIMVEIMRQGITMFFIMIVFNLT